MPHARLTCLTDPPELHTGADGEPLPPGKPFAALVFIALSRKLVARDDLARLLWPRAPREKALQSARQALSSLRKHIGDTIGESGDPVPFNRSRMDVDVNLLSAALDSGRVDVALDLWKAPFLHRFTIPAAPDWDQWVDEMRESLAGRMTRALVEQIAKARKEARTTEALRYCRRCVEIAPFEIAHAVRLIETCLEAAQLDEAAEALAQARRTFADAEYADTLERLTSRLHVLRREQPRSEADPLSRPELVGRSTELSQLLAAWHAARAGDSSLVFLAGPAGIGKTRLVQEITDVAAADRARTVYVKATEAERRLPWSVAVMLVRSMLGLPGAAGVTAASDRLLRSLVPSLSNGVDGAPHAPTIGEARSAALTDAVADLVSAVAYENPLFVAIDDLHWVDRESLALLAQIAREARNQRVLFAFTFRREDLAVESRGAVGGLESDQRSKSIELRPLTDADVAELLSAVVSVHDDAQLTDIAHRVHAVTSGNPFFITEVLKAFAQDGVLTRDSSGWKLEAGRVPAELPLPRSVQELINRRLARLSTPATAIAAHLAELPSSAPVRVLRRHVDLSDGAFAKALGELIDRDVVRWDGDEHLTFAHDQIRRAARKRLHGTFTIREHPVRWRTVGMAAALVILLGTLWFSGAIARLASIAPGVNVRRAADYVELRENALRRPGALILGVGTPGHYTCGDTIVARERTVRVFAKERWTTMGIDAHAGCDILEFSAAGTVELADDMPSATPDGTPTNVSFAFAPAPHLPIFALICRIAGRQPFLVGAGATLPVSDTGTLECGVNEGHTVNDVYLDNKGYWTVRVRIHYNALAIGSPGDSAAATKRVP